MNIGQTTQPGELNTRIRIQRKITTRPPGSISSVVSWVDIGSQLPTDPPRYKWCKWVSAHGKDLLRMDMQVAVGAATLTLRFDKRITSDCRIIKRGDLEHPYSIIGEPENVREQNQYTVLSVKREVPD